MLLFQLLPLLLVMCCCESVYNVQFIEVNGVYASASTAFPVFPQTRFFDLDQANTLKEIERRRPLQLERKRKGQTKKKKEEKYVAALAVMVKAYSLVPENENKKEKNKVKIKKKRKEKKTEANEWCRASEQTKSFK